VPLAELDDVFRRLLLAAKRGAVIYLSFKLGTGERVKEGRRFTDFTDENLVALVGMFPEAEILRIWQTADVRRGRDDEIWVNALVRRSAS
jgi:hypothetical protein